MASDIAIVGGGIVGLAAGRALLRRHPRLRLVVLEKEAVLAAHQSGHNSGVVHSGIYYEPGSLKARLCVQGRRDLYEYCDRKGIEYRQVGKLIVAVMPHELPRLGELMRRGIANGIEGLQMLDARGIAKREPHCRGIGAIFSPATGIVDFRVVARSFGDDVRAAGGAIHTGREVIAIERRGATNVLHTSGGDYETRLVITCAGLQSDRLARMTGGKSDPQIVPFRGDFLILKPHARSLVRGNIYLVPDPALPFVGAHFTQRISGDVWLGPNAVLAFAREGYALGSINVRDLFETLTYSGFRKLAARHLRTGIGELYRDVARHAYVRSLQRYVPELRVEDTLTGPSGVRAQAILPDGSFVDDFVFDAADGVIHVRNAPSPAATSALAIAAHIADHAGARFDWPKAVAV